MSEAKDPALNKLDHIPEPLPPPIPPQNPYLPQFSYPVTTDPVEEVEATPGLEERVEAAMERMDEQGDVMTSASDLREVLIAEADAFEDDTKPPKARRKK